MACISGGPTHPMEGHEDICQGLTQEGLGKERVQNEEGGQNLDLWGAFVLDNHEGQTEVEGAESLGGACELGDQESDREVGWVVGGHGPVAVVSGGHGVEVVWVEGSGEERDRVTWNGDLQARD